MELPVVLIDSYFEDGVEDCYNVGLDDFGGGYRMTSYLIRQGHRHIAFLADEKEPVGVDRERLKGYQKALEEKCAANSQLQNIRDSFGYGDLIAHHVSTPCVVLADDGKDLRIHGAFLCVRFLRE